ncbi:MAG: RNA polymerase II mediator complex subunit [Trichoglossum hirsutum]|nr:MAG: RNA polymerase II mediator complex subunit [Trichoglossum hirsutum]
MTSRPSVGIQRPRQRSTSGSVSRPPNGGVQQSQSTGAGGASDRIISDTAFDGGRPATLGNGRLSTPHGLNIQLPALSNGNSPEIGGGASSLGASDGSATSLPKPASRGRTGLRPKALSRLPSTSGRVHLSTAETNSPGVGVRVIRSQSPPPMPVRPGKQPPRQARKVVSRSDAQATIAKKDSRPKPYILEAPPCAPHLRQEKYADFFPWTGNHPEDILTEQTTRQGFYDKTQVSQNEHTTARPTLWPIFKRQSGIQVLSSLLVSVLEQRQSHGRITAASTFKPPPRVTLTDTKREAWLRDLANPSVPLRRLSRTIPHGIRGKALLDQCLSKNIPTGRAVWLARCVGANEIRAFKRKGAGGAFAMGGEVKWIRDWTAFVEQFVDTVISNCGEKDWKVKISYAVRLSAHLFSEHLLDREHYLDWFITQLESCSLERLPMWLLILQIYWQELVQHRRYGRRLAEALLKKLQVASASEDKEVFAPITQRISELVTTLIISNRECFVIPRVWADYHSTLESSIDRAKPNVASAFENVWRRNDRLSPPVHRRSGKSGDTPKRQLIQILDAVRTNLDIDQLSNICTSVIKDRDALVQVLLEWASSPYRVGLSRVYLVVRLLRRWNRGGMDTDEIILDFLSRSRRNTGICSYNVYLLVAELVRSRHFSVTRYLRWLIARGALGGYKTLDPDEACDKRLLAELALGTLPTHVRNLRKMLLEGVGFSVQDEQQCIYRAKSTISALLPGFFDPTDFPESNEQYPTESNLDSLKFLSRTIKSEISLWLRRQVNLHVVQGVPVGPNNWRDLTIEVGISAITVEQFTVIRRILEDFDDFSILADVLKMASSSDNSIVLASVADTVNYHLETFTAIGAANECFEVLLERHRSLKVRRVAEKFLLVSLFNLASAIPGGGESMQHLAGELAKCDQRAAVAACSPVSDHMTDVLQSTDADFNEDIERLLSSGTSMDKHTLARLFETVLSRMESAWGDSEPQLLSFGLLLARLRTFDERNFDDLMSKWVSRLLLTISRPTLSQTLPPLVNSRCVALSTVISCSADLLDSKSHELDEITAANVAAETLELLFGGDPDRFSPVDYDSYHFRLEQQRFVAENSRETLSVIRRAIERGSTKIKGSHQDMLGNLLASVSVSSALRRYIVHDTANTHSCLILPLTKLPPDGSWRLKQIMDRLLEGSNSNGTTLNCYIGLRYTPLTQTDLSEMDPEVQVTKILQIADEFSLPFCQIKLQLIFNSEKSSTSTDRTIGQITVTTSFFHAISSAIQNQNFAWADLVSALDDDVARYIREHAEEQLLNSAPFSKNCLTSNFQLSQCQEPDESSVRRFMPVIENTCFSIPATGVPTLAPILVDKLNGLAQYISFRDNDAGRTSSDDACVQRQTGAEQFCEVRLWIVMFLRLIVIHRNMFQGGKTCSWDQSRLIISICSLLQNEHVQRDEVISEYAFDVATYLVDELGEEARVQCTKFLKDKTHEPRFQHLFGYQEGSGNGLHVVQRDKVAPFHFRRWEILSEPTPNVGENDTSLSLTLFRARKSHSHRSSVR